MIRFSAALVAVAIGVLIGGIATSELLLVYIAIVVSAVALVALAIGVVLKRETSFSGRTGDSRPLVRALALVRRPAAVKVKTRVQSAAQVTPPLPFPGAAVGYAGCLRGNRPGGPVAGWCGPFRDAPGHRSRGGAGQRVRCRRGRARPANHGRQRPSATRAGARAAARVAGPGAGRSGRRPGRYRRRYPACSGSAQVLGRAALFPVVARTVSADPLPADAPCRRAGLRIGIDSAQLVRPAGQPSRSQAGRHRRPPARKTTTGRLATPGYEDETDETGEADAAAARPEDERPVPEARPRRSRSPGRRRRRVQRSPRPQPWLPPCWPGRPATTAPATREVPPLDAGSNLTAGHHGQRVRGPGGGG